MTHLQVKATNVLPAVDFNGTTGELSLHGKSVPDDGKEFYENILVWLNEYAKAPAELTHFNFHLEYFNISSSKSFLFILYKLVEIQDAGHKVKITWLYSDAYILGAGRDYAFMAKLPFDFVKVAKKELSL
jgi:hypothetical protein